MIIEVLCCQFKKKPIMFLSMWCYLTVSMLLLEVQRFSLIVQKLGVLLYNYILTIIYNFF